MNEPRTLRRIIDDACEAHGFDELVGDSPALTAVKQYVRAVADTSSTVLLCGETGTGKELIARALHRLSARRDGPFVKINCAAIPAGLLESELMGHEKGAFTGAIMRRIGRFERAQDGTIFLDEIGELSLDLQPKLLRLLQEHEFERVGGERTLQSNARVIAATNRDLAQMVAARTFREDLYYRLSVFPIRIPPLRERRQDITPLIEHFLAMFAARVGRAPLRLEDETIVRLLRHDWPGNIRELENVLERAVILNDGVLIPETATPAAAAPTVRTTELAHDPCSFIREHLQFDPTNLYASTHHHLDRLLFDLVLQHVHGNLRSAARVLGISRQTLRVKLRALEMRVERSVVSCHEGERPS
jgi:transcriptional regulator with GAF, ATPase, and Fis domain